MVVVCRNDERIFEYMKERFQLTYLSDLHQIPDKVKNELFMMDLSLYSSRELTDFFSYVFGKRIQEIIDMKKYLNYSKIYNKGGCYR